MAECTECGKFTKYNGGLCTECYNKRKSNVAIADNAAENSFDDFDEAKGLSH